MLSAVWRPKRSHPYTIRKARAPGCGFSITSWRVSAAAQGVICVDADHARIDGGQVRLQFGAAAFRLNGGDGIGVCAVLDQLERHRATVFRVLRQVHIGHPAASQLANDFVFADFAAGGGDHGRTGLLACLPSLSKAGETACPTNPISTNAGRELAVVAQAVPPANLSALGRPLIASPLPPAGPRVRRPDDSAAPGRAPAPGRS